MKFLRLFTASLFFILIFFLKVNFLSAASLTLTNVPTEKQVDEEFTVSIEFSISKENTDYYFRPLFHESGSTQYSGCIKNNSSEWICGSQDANKYFKATTNNEGSVQTNLSLKSEKNGSLFLKIRALTEGGSESATSDDSSLISFITPTPTITNTPTNTLTPTITLTPTQTFTPTITPTATETLTPSPTKTLTPTKTPTVTKTPTLTPTGNSPNPTNTNTPTPTNKFSPTPTNKVSPTLTATETQTKEATKSGEILGLNFREQTTPTPTGKVEGRSKTEKGFLALAITLVTAGAGLISAPFVLKKKKKTKE